MNRAEILDTAKQYVIEDRNTQYGDPENSFQTIANFWNTYLYVRTGSDLTIKPYDVAVMMMLLKTARMANMPRSPDSAIDAAGYAACAGELLGVPVCLGRETSMPAANTGLASSR